MENTEKKTCNGCESKELEKTENSLAWEMLKELSKTVKRQTVIIFVVLALWFTTIVGFVWYLSLYDFSSYEVSTDGGGNAYYSEQSGDGEINYGTNNGQEENEEKQKQS
ncbi:MAG: hypothetical protein IKY45_00175 [Clostridia bacterium]|nr:hypothetical protein [Clostridia bacterium]